MVQVSRIYDKGFLYLKGDPVSWIQLNLSHRLSVRRLELCDYEGENIGDSIAELAELTHLFIGCCKLLKCVTNVIRLHNLRVLEINGCPNLQELPQNMGDLINLTLLQLSNCKAIKSLPNSIADISNLSTLILMYCETLSELPGNINVVDLRLLGCCRIQSLPRCLPNLVHLNLQLCSLSQQRFPNFTAAKRLPRLTISVCKDHPVRSQVIKNLPTFAGLRYLQRLCLCLNVEEFPIDLDELPHLMLLDIHSCVEIKFLPSNLKCLLHLQFLYLPSDFRLETLPFHLNDSVVISVEGIHIRKTWEQLKLEIGSLFVADSPPLVEMLTIATRNSSPLFDTGYLSLKEDPSSWMVTHSHLHLLVRILDLELPDNVEKIGDVIGSLENLTHLYILRGIHLSCLPDTTTRLTRLSLHACKLDYLSDSMGKLSNLKSLDLDLYQTEFSAALDPLFCLEHLTIRNSRQYSLPDSMANLTNLTTLELYWCDQVSLPENLNLTKLKLVCSSAESLLKSLCYLEIVHDMDYCFYIYKCGDDFKMCLKQLVNLKTLSLSCYTVKLFPSIAGQQILQTLLLKDCFNLRELMPNMDDLVELCTLNISGTRIKSLPESITKLPKLQHLVLPKCFKKKNLPHQFLGNESLVEIEFDGMDETYYKDMGYCGSHYESSTETSDEGIINVQTSSCRLPNPPEATQGLGDIRISRKNYSTSEMENHNQETEILSSNAHSMEIVGDMITELSSNFQEINNFGGDRQLYEESTFGVRSSAHDRNNHHVVLDAQNNSNPHGAVKKGNRQKIAITHEQIQSLRGYMTLIEAAKELGVSRSTMKRRCKHLGLGEWPSSRKKKSNCTMKRKISTMSPSGGEFSQPNLVECANPCGPDYANQCLDVIQHKLPDQVAPECDSIDHSTSNAIIERVGELNVTTHRHMDVHESLPECTVGPDIYQLLGNVQDSSSSSNFDIKATYKEDIVRFKWSSTACLIELKQAMAENLNIKDDSFKLKYLDEEEDWVLINTNEHLQRALSLIKNNILRLKVIDL